MSANRAIRVHSTTASPAGHPQPLAYHNERLWIGCWDTNRIYGVDAKSIVRAEAHLPGRPMGMASLGDAIHIVVSIGENDDRYVYRYIPGQPITDDRRFACPEFMGSHMTSDGKRLLLVQQGNRRILRLDEAGTVDAMYSLPTNCAGAAYVDGTLFILSADEEFDALELATLDVTTPEVRQTNLGAIDAEARGLATDGKTWWTSLRDRSELLAFTL